MPHVVAGTPGYESDHYEWFLRIDTCPLHHGRIGCEPFRPKIGQLMVAPVPTMLGAKVETEACWSDDAMGEGEGDCVC